MVFQLTNIFYHSKQAQKSIKLYALINEDFQITKSCQETWAVALKYEMKHENKPYGNIPSASSPKAIVIKQKIILR
jgi:hypothetical protein